MTKEITKAYILQQLQDKFGLRESDLAKFLFSETVQPTYDIGMHVEEVIANFKAVSITSTGGFEFYEVPPTERWWLNRYVVVFMGAGAIKVSGVYVRRKLELIDNSVIYFDMTLNQTISYTVDLPKSARLDPGDKLFVNVDDYTSTQDLRLYIDYIKEEIR